MNDNYFRVMCRKIKVLGCLLLICLCGQNLLGEDNGESEQALQVSAMEDLMREHGVLNRILLIYEEIIKRLPEGKYDSLASLLKQSAGIIQDFIENYHEQLEENYIFPRFEKAGRMVELVKTLRTQHERGRQLTKHILAHSSADELKDPKKRQAIIDILNEFIAMYRPHEAREDTVLFPAFKDLITQDEYDSLGDLFERKETDLFGSNGFQDVVDQVAEIEKELGIYKLSQFTPSSP